MSEPQLTCQVCQKEPALGVACSPLGPVSIAYGRSCLAAHAEPYDLLVTTVALCGGRANCATWVEPIVNASLSVAIKSLVEFDADVDAMIVEMLAEEERRGL